MAIRLNILALLLLVWIGANAQVTPFMPADTVVCNNTASRAAPKNCTVANVVALLSVPTLDANGHLLFSGSEPTITDSGSDTLTYQAGCVDNKCAVTGMVSATTVTVTFAKAFATIPTCVANLQQSSGSASVYVSSATSPTTLAVVFATSTAVTGGLTYVCF